MSFSEFAGILADWGRGTREYHSTNIPSGMECPDVWSDVLAEARRRGMSVRFVEGYVQIGAGSFQDNEGGAAYARQALNGGAA